MKSHVAKALPACFLPLAGCCLLLVGCSSWPHSRNAAPGVPSPQLTTATPTAADLVAYWNRNAQRIQTLECNELHLDATHGMQSIGMVGNLVCQKQRNFRLSAKVGGNTMVDMGSNNQEFWYWISKNDPPYLFHCSHQDFAQGRARMQFPFQPDWIMEALGMAELDPNKNYQVVTKPTTFELVEQTVSPQGQQVRKVTVFNRNASQIQVSAHLLQDANGKEICSANITHITHDRASGADIPQRVQLVWPSEKIKLKMKLEEVSVNGALDETRVARLFTRPPLEGVQPYNLAQGLGTPTSQLRRTGGIR